MWKLEANIDYFVGYTNRINHFNLDFNMGSLFCGGEMEAFFLNKGHPFSTYAVRGRGGGKFCLFPYVRLYKKLRTGEEGSKMYKMLGTYYIVQALAISPVNISKGRDQTTCMS